jgi:hypothetical protein
LLRSWNPRLNPMLRPDEWERAARRNRLRLAAVVASCLVVALGVAAHFWYPADRTRNLTPEMVVEKAGLALLQAGQYHFQMDLSGEASEYPFPNAVMKGEFQKDPPLIHLAGTVDSGESRIPLEYYLEAQTLYMLDPVTKQWIFLQDSPVDELTSFSPENLAAPFLGGVLKVEELGRERLAGGPAVRYRLELSPDVMLPRQPDLHADLVTYELWVYTRTLEPARFSMQVVRRQPAHGDQPAANGDRFTYELTWQFRGLAPLVVPDAIKSSAQDVGVEAPPAQP